MTAARRSCLAVPGSSQKMLAKAAGIAADEVVIDLEDAVGASAKEQARALVTAALQSGGWRPEQSVSVRINAPGSPWCNADLAAIAGLDDPPATVVVPKVQQAGDIAFVERFLDGADAETKRPRSIGIQALIETAAGVENVSVIADGSARLVALIVGYADLTASLGQSPALTQQGGSWDVIRGRILVAARAHGLQAIDGPYLGIHPDAAFEACAKYAADQGFDGKWAVHPDQIPSLNRIFTPDPDELERARAVLEALAAAEAGAVALDGEMLDAASRSWSMRVIARARAIEGPR